MKTWETDHALIKLGESKFMRAQIAAPFTTAALLMEAFCPEKELILDRSYRILQSKPKPVELPQGDFTTSVTVLMFYGMGQN